MDERHLHVEGFGMTMPITRREGWRGDVMVIMVICVEDGSTEMRGKGGFSSAAACGDDMC